MKRVAILLAAVVAALGATGVAAAHPLGNFTTNQYAEVVVSGDRAYVSLRPRPRRDPDLPGGGRGACARP